MNTPIQVVTSCDSKYLPYLAVLASSLAASRLPETAIELAVLQRGIDDRDRASVAAAAPGIGLQWIELDESAYRAAGVADEPALRAPHYFRCFIGELLPGIRRCIYLDSDILVRADLSALWAEDLSGAVIGAALDYFVARTAVAIAPWRELGLDPDAAYFNSGVLLIDLGGWRSAEIGARVLRTCLRHSDHLLAQGKWPQYDQFGLNVVLHQSWHRISQDWNYLSEMDLSDPYVIHYCGGGKPSSPTCQPQFSAWFYETLARTAWRERRP